jgi:DNA-directed RNA polymerase specialized sigma24 family protein
VADEQDLGSIYRRYWTLVRGCAWRIVGDAATAEDITQEVFMRYWAYREKGGKRFSDIYPEGRKRLQDIIRATVTRPGP